MMWLFIECHNQYAFDVPLYPIKRIFIDLASNFLKSSFGTKAYEVHRNTLKYPIEGLWPIHSS
jgi:hypothetical protein